jgi:hypothetical protein
MEEQITIFNGDRDPRDKPARPGAGWFLNAAVATALQQATWPKKILPGRAPIGYEKRESRGGA